MRSARLVFSLDPADALALEGLARLHRNSIAAECRRAVARHLAEEFADNPADAEPADATSTA